jgi:hypothetical protein
MRNTVKLLGALALLLAAISASAQHTTQVTVPFEFAAAGRILPPGDYRVTFNESSELVMLRGPDLNSMILMTAPGDRFKDERNVLRFQRYGNQWSLRQVVFAGSVRVLPAPKSKARDMASGATSDPSFVEIPLVAFNRSSSANAGVN